MTTVVDFKIKQFKDIDAEIQTLYRQKTTLLAQFNENTLVKGELDILSDKATDEHPAKVYKLVGPVLMTVELDDAKENVSKRVEFIEQEITKTDNLIAAKQGLQTDLGLEIQKLQEEMRKDTILSVSAANQASKE